MLRLVDCQREGRRGDRRKEQTGRGREGKELKSETKTRQKTNQERNKKKKKKKKKRDKLQRRGGTVGPTDRRAHVVRARDPEIGKE